MNAGELALWIILVYLGCRFAWIVMRRLFRLDTYGRYGRG